MSEWTERRQQQLRDDWAAGLTMGQIGNRLGISRGAVSGQVTRLGLPRRTAGRPVGRHSQVAAAPTAAPPKPPRPIHDAGIVLGQSCSLFHLTNATCRWPVGNPVRADFFFCGNPSADNQAGRPYCPWHTKVARGEAAL